ncbi:MAG: PAS domain S-box protein [Deltaproteobacteria bacterium]|nr:PAS domain S-box protein [Deltaproteobacteria bacterium]
MDHNIRELTERLKEKDALLRQETEKREAAEKALRTKEKALNEMLREMPVVIFAYDKDGGILFYSREFERISGYTPEDIQDHPQISDLLFPHEESDIGPAGESKKEWRFRAKDGSEKVIAWSDISRYFPFPGWKSWKVGVDVTELKRLERMREDLERIARHDLKTPLVDISGLSATLLYDDNLTEEQREIVTYIEKSGERMLNMVENSLTLYKIEAGSYVHEPTEVDLIQLFFLVERQLGALCRGRSIRLLFLVEGMHITEGRTYGVSGVPSLLENLFVNLIKNAIEASPENDTVRVNVSFEADHVIDIHNQGVIPEEIRSRFFDRFASSGKKGGTGLGTYSAKLIARAHGGDVRFTTSDEQGTHVIVTLPK